MTMATGGSPDFKVEDLADATFINVCAACKKASCWLGEFMCDEARYADVHALPVGRLRQLNREHPDYWAAEIRARFGAP